MDRMRNMDEQVRNYFLAMSPQQRSVHEKKYEKLLAINAGTYKPGVYPITHKLAGKQMPYPPKLEWMTPHWENGLRILNEIVNR